VFIEYGWEISDQTLRHEAQVERAQKDTIRTIQSLAQELKWPLGSLRGLRLTKESADTVSVSLYGLSIESTNLASTVIPHYHLRRLRSPSPRAFHSAHSLYAPAVPALLCSDPRPSGGYVEEGHPLPHLGRSPDEDARGAGLHYTPDSVCVSATAASLNPYYLK